jgi:serine/threonine-protein kinase
VTSTAHRLSKACPECKSLFGEDAVFCPKDGARLEEREEVDPYIGTLLSGDIEIQSIAGQGAMGKVYRAHQRGIDRTVAVKILHRELSGNAQLLRRFHREAKIASKLQHPHVVEVHLAGQLPDGAMYMVMEYLDGRSLATALADARGMLPLPRALGIVLQICEAVGAGHALGIVHRDLKPENVMLVNRAEVDDWVKVLDFGIARIELGDQSMETAAGRIFGTARYISPEGARGEQVGPPGDVYAIATMLYQLLAGATPFEAPTTIALLMKHLHDDPPPLAANAPGVPDAIVRVVMANLGKDPAARAQNARALGASLAAAANEAAIYVPKVHVVERLSHLPASQLEPTLDESIPVEPPPPEPPELETPPETKPAKSRIWIVTIALAFTLGVVLTMVAMKVAGGQSEHAAYIERARSAFADGHYVAPPGENVEELVKNGLTKWPNDPELKSIRSDAEHEMITMAMAAHQSGDLVGARNLARDAYRLEPTDNSARFERAQSEDDLAAIASGAAVHTGAPRLVFESPPVVKTGDPVEMTCRIVPGAAGPKAKIAGIKISVFPNGQTTGGAPVTFANSDPSNVRASVSAPAVGSWDITFEATVDGQTIRAMRDLDVVAR